MRVRIRMKRAFALSVAAAVLLTPGPGVPRAALVGADERETFAEYARRTGKTVGAVERMFSGVGRFVCPWTFGSAILVKRRDLIIFPSHFLFETSGARKGDARTCRVGFGVSGTIAWRRLDVTSIFAGSRDGHSNASPEFDWAVARLTRAVPGIEPYSIVDKGLGPAQYLRRYPVVQVAMGAHNWTGHRIDEPSVSECAVHVWGSFAENAVWHARTDCDNGRGSSGAAVGFVRGESRFELLGMTVGSSGLDKPRAPFHVSANSTYTTTIEGAFLSAIEALADRGR